MWRRSDGTDCREFDPSAAFRMGLADFVKILKGIRVIRFTADDDSCAAALELDTVFGVIPFLEHFHIVSGQILSIRAYYDPRPVLDPLTPGLLNTTGPVGPASAAVACGIPWLTRERAVTAWRYAVRSVNGCIRVGTVTAAYEPRRLAYP
jgi:hypothetical protein